MCGLHTLEGKGFHWFGRLGPQFPTIFSVVILCTSCAGVFPSSGFLHFVTFCVPMITLPEGGKFPSICKNFTLVSLKGPSTHVVDTWAEMVPRWVL